MNRHQEQNRVKRQVEVAESPAEGQTDVSALLRLPKANLVHLTIADARITSLKVLALMLLTELDSLETHLNQEGTLNLQAEVQRFEAALIRAALIKTGGKQRRAARLLGSKVTTLNTKIRRYGIDISTLGPE